MGERFTVRLEAKIGDEWRVISELPDSGSQNTGRMRRVADGAVVPMRVVEVHDDG